MSDHRNWHSYELAVRLPQLSVGKLSEVELFKELGMVQWETISNIAQVPVGAIANENNERLYSSFVSVELSLGEEHKLEDFDEGDTLFVKNKVQFFGKKIAEGFFLFDHVPIEEKNLHGIVDVQSLRASKTPWAYMTHAFVVRSQSNKHLQMFTPVALKEKATSDLAHMPMGIQEQMQAERTGQIPEFDGQGRWIEIRPFKEELIEYPIVFESDISGAGLLYCVRYVSLMNYAERIFLGNHVAPPFSTEVIACLTTEKRRLYYFANADPTDSVLFAIKGSIQIPERAGTPAKLRTMMKFLFRIDMLRASDKVLMASCLVQKALRIPGHQKSSITEAERILSRL